MSGAAPDITDQRNVISVSLSLWTACASKLAHPKQAPHLQPRCTGVSALSRALRSLDRHCLGMLASPWSDTCWRIMTPKTLSMAVYNAVKVLALPMPACQKPTRCCAVMSRTTLSSADPHQPQADLVALGIAWRARDCVRIEVRTAWCFLVQLAGHSIAAASAQTLPEQCADGARVRLRARRLRNVGCIVVCHIIACGSGQQGWNSSMSIRASVAALARFLL
jgi:hypothetical protein